jgi:hypothetical protein
MQRIIVNVISLEAKLLEIEKEGMDFIELSIVPSQIEDENLYPAFLHLEGVSKDGTCKDYESIDEFSVLENVFLNKSA